ncbi:amidase [Mesorhizobium sp. CO1-1-8]|uniref:amidase n=1 Tax=Mesorhizobium sp. CO1-1-8 TaxID=2876631 RepID=UPI001CD0F573|nr:amidase [Mesorhizobium sp. CO1-1-8]MBZ9774084.1 amidase [Mesorhizobium sp. CO1-1-8]
MTDLDLCYMPASEALRLLKAKKLSPVELMQATIRRAEATKATINCFTFTHFDEAMDLAGKAEAKYARAPGPGRSRGCRSASRTRATSRASQPRTARCCPGMPSVAIPRR